MYRLKRFSQFSVTEFSNDGKFDSVELKDGELNLVWNGSGEVDNKNLKSKLDSLKGNKKIKRIIVSTPGNSKGKRDKWKITNL